MQQKQQPPPPPQQQQQQEEEEEEEEEEAYMREACKPPEARNPRVEFEWARLAAHDTDPRISDEGMRILEDLLKRQLDEFEEGCLYFLATAHRHRGELKVARQYLEMGVDRHPGSERISEELRGLRLQVQKDGVLGVATICGIVGVVLVLIRLVRR